MEEMSAKEKLAGDRSPHWSEYLITICFISKPRHMLCVPQRILEYLQKM